MNKAERVYYNTEMLGRAKIAEKTTMVLRDSAPMIGQIRFPYNLQSINQLYFLLENGYYPWLEKSLKHYGYEYR